MSTTPDPDPRFDPRFQRGYDGPEPVAPPTPALPSPIEPGGSPLPVAPASAAEPELESAREVIAHETGVGAESNAGPDDNVFWAPPRRNPFGIVLLVGGLAMIAVGLWLVWSVITASTFPDGYDRAAQAFQVVQQQLTPALLTAGVLGIVGWLVLGALGASTRKHD